LSRGREKKKIAGGRKNGFGLRGGERVDICVKRIRQEGSPWTKPTWEAKASLHLLGRGKQISEEGDTRSAQQMNERKRTGGGRGKKHEGGEPRRKLKKNLRETTSPARRKERSPKKKRRGKGM